MFAAALAPWKLCNLRALGVWEKEVLNAGLAETEAHYHSKVERLFDQEKRQQKLSKCSVVQCKPLNELPGSPAAQYTPSMVRSNKVQLADTLKSSVRITHWLDLH